MAPNGNLTVSCTTGDPVPACSLTAPGNAQVGVPFSLTASCNNSPTAYNWTTNATGVTLPTGASGTVTVATAGTYTFSVSGTNAAGTGPIITRSVSVETPTLPVCTAYTSSSPAYTNEDATITLTCSGAPTVFAWAMYEASLPQPTGLVSQTTSGQNTQTIRFTQPGTYLFAGQAGNSLGSSNVIGMSVTVTNRPTGGGGCPASGAVGPTPGYETLGHLRYDLKPNQHGTASFAIPLDGKNGVRISIAGATNLETPRSSIGEVALADCPGKFDEVPATCKGTFGFSGNVLYVGEHWQSQCPMTGAKYMNIRNLTCNPAPGFNACTWYVDVVGQ